MAEACNSRYYYIHSSSTKMYHNLREIYWWSSIKRDIADFAAKFPNCEQVKVDHQRPCGVAQNFHNLG